MESTSTTPRETVYDTESYYGEDGYYDDTASSFDWDELVIAPISTALDRSHIIATGSVGRWDGRSKGGKVLETLNEFYDLLKDCDIIKVEKDEKALYITATHHDGTNYYTLRELTQKGLDYYYNEEGNPDLTDEELHETLMKDGLSKPIALVE